MEQKKINSVENRFLTHPVDSNQERITHLLDYSEGAPLNYSYGGRALKFYIVYAIRDVNFVEDRKQWDKIVTIAYDRKQAIQKVLDAYKNSIKKIMCSFLFIRHSGEHTLTDKKVKVGFYKKVEDRKVYSHTQTYRLYINETPEMLEYSLMKHYSSYYYVTILKEANKKMEKPNKLQLIKELRKKTNGKLHHCNEIITSLLKEDSELPEEDIIKKAVALMSEKKQIVAATMVNKDANFFVIKHQLAPLNSKGVLLKFGCQSEQGSVKLKTEYDSILHDITSIAISKDCKYKRDLLLASYDENNTVQMKLDELSGTLSESVKLIQLEEVSNTEDISDIHTDVYVHGNEVKDRIGGILLYTTKDKTNEDIIRKVLHQLVTTNPLVLEEEELIPSILKDIERNATSSIRRDNILFDVLTKMETKKPLKDEEKAKLNQLKKVPDNVIPNIIKGKVNKFKKEVTFNLQEWMFPEPAEEGKKVKKQTIAQLLKEKEITLIDFIVV